jgi:hypothetical protein
MLIVEPLPCLAEFRNISRSLAQLPGARCVRPPFRRNTKSPEAAVLEGFLVFTGSAGSG